MKMEDRPIPKVGETWQGKTHKHQKVKVIEVGHHDVVWESASGDRKFQSREMITTFRAHFEPEG